jgi:beta-mannosidase
VEYGPAGGETAGQVVGGRWKPLHYWLRSHLFSTYFAACDVSGACVVRNDSPLAPLAALLEVSAVSTRSGVPLGTLSGPTPIALPRGAGAMAWGCMDGKGVPPGCAPPSAVLGAAGCSPSGTDCAVLSVLRSASTGEELARNLQFWAVPSALQLAVGVTVTAKVGQQAADGSVPVTISVQGGAALLVLLSSAAQGRWSDNALQLLAPGLHQVVFLPMLQGGLGPPVDATLLTSSLRVEHLGQG